jgi:hypothetical protein
MQLFDKSYECCRYYESIGAYDKSSTMFYKCGEHDQALRLILQLGTHDAMELVQFVITMHC